MRLTENDDMEMLPETVSVPIELPGATVPPAFATMPPTAPNSCLHAIADLGEKFTTDPFRTPSIHHQSNPANAGT